MAAAMEAEAGPSGGAEPAVEPPRSEAEQRWWFSTEDEEDEEEEDDEAEPGPAGAAGGAGDGDELYDEALDDKDDTWATKQRSGRDSDAILSCPCCLETVCIDCQKHARYHSQFRAMFVRNCVVKRDQRLRAAGREGGRGSRGGRGGRGGGRGGSEAAPDAAAAEETFFPVVCGTCSTEIGVFDAEEVYHFFNVVATTA